MKKRRLNKTPAKPFKLSSTKQKALLSLLSELIDKTISQECTRHNSTVVDCCNYLIETLGGKDENLT